MSSSTDVKTQSLLDAAIATYVEANPSSKTFYENACNQLPGGNTRTVLYASPFPIYMKSGQGYQVNSEDGKTYTDFLGEFTAGLYGHSHPVLVEAITNAISTTGLSIGATTRQEHIFAQEVCERFGLEQVRFCNSGTEANLHALAAARAFTKKRKVVTFEGGYHGAVLGFRGRQPAANCVDRHDFIVASYNDVKSARQAIASEGVAAVLMEAMQGSAGGIVADAEFLKAIQEAARLAGVLLIIDEVMTSRLSSNGLSALRGLQPDLKTFGKYLGGGLAFGAFGGRADVMAVFDPRRPDSLAHSGTFNNNTLVTHAGHAGLTRVYTKEAAAQFTQVGDDFRERLNEATKSTKMCFTGIGTIMVVHFPKDGRRTIDRVGDVEENEVLKELFWFEMLEEGFWFAKRGFLSLILGTPKAELDRFVSCVEAFVKKHQESLAIGAQATRNSSSTI